MPLTFITRADGLVCPTFLCDRCGKPILAKDGIVLWDPDYMDGVEIVGPIHYLHKGACDVRFSGKRFYMSRELDEFVLQVVYNSGEAEILDAEILAANGG